MEAGRKRRKVNALTLAKNLEKVLASKAVSTQQLERLEGLLDRFKLVVRRLREARQSLDVKVGALASWVDEVKNPSPEIVAWEEQNAKHDLSESIDTMELSVRAYNCLKNADITTIGELVEKTDEELLRIKNFNKKPLLEVKEELARLSLSLRPSK